MQLMSYNALKTPSLSTLKPASVFVKQDCQAETPAMAPTFGQKKSDKKFLGVFAAAALGLMSTLGGVGTYLYSWTALSKPQPPVMGQVDLPLERSLEAEKKQFDKSVTRGMLFDSVSGSVKSGLWRFATGERVSEGYKDKAALKVLKNSMREGEDHVWRVNTLIAELSGDANAKSTISRLSGRSKASQAEYYDAMETVLNLANVDKKEQGLTSKLIWGSYEKQLKAATEKMEKNDRVFLASLLTRLSAADKSGDVTEYHAVYKEFVEKIVAKYEPEQVEACLAAGQKLFDSMQTVRDGVNAQNQQNAADFEANMTAYDQRKGVLNSYAGKLTGFGLLGFLMFGAGAYVMAGQTNRNKP